MGPLAKEVAAPPRVSRLTHWVNAIATIIMVRSGSRIYNGSPFFPLMFPNCLTIGDWLGGALAIHFAMMWVLWTSMLVYLCHGLATGGLRRRLLPMRLAELVRDMRLALTFRLSHEGLSTAPSSACCMSASSPPRSRSSLLAWRYGNRCSRSA
jgi:thiosulfate reductase cytochrome b subunit